MPVYSTVSLTIPDIDAADPVEAAKVFQAALSDYALLPLTYVVEDAATGAGYMIDLQPLQVSVDAAYEKACEMAARAQGWRPMTQTEVSAIEWLKDVTISAEEGDIFTKDNEPDYDPHDGFRNWQSLCAWHDIDPAGQSDGMSKAERLLRRILETRDYPRGPADAVEAWENAESFIAGIDRAKAEA